MRMLLKMPIKYKRPGELPPVLVVVFVVVLVVVVCSIRTADGAQMVQGKGAWFYPETLCDMATREAMYGCRSRRVLSSASGDLAACSMICSVDDQCMGASLDASGQCYVHDVCSPLDCKGNPQVDHTYVSKNCRNGGVWQTSWCRCPHGLGGRWCDMIAFSGPPLAIEPRK